MKNTTIQFRVLLFGGIGLFLLLLSVQVRPVLAQSTSLAFNALPSDQGWVYNPGESGVAETTVFSVNSGLLHMDTINTGVGYSGLGYYRFDVVNPDAPFTLTVNARVTDYEVQSNDNPWGFHLSVYTGSESFEVGISPARIVTIEQDIAYSVDVAQFHEYRMVGQSGSFELFIDNVSYGIFPSYLSDFSNRLAFGDGTGGANSIVDIASYNFVQTSPFNFTGFFSPVDNQPILNTVRAGSAVPIKFSLGGNRGLNIFAQGYPASAPVTCGSSVEDAVEETVTANASGLSYNAADDQYIYVWKTDRAWANTCRTLVVRLSDGTSHLANFRFR